MQQATIKNQRDADGNIQRAKSIKEEHPRFIARRRQSIKRQQEAHKPENGVNRLDGELCSSEQERKQRDMACDS
jgi:hypothetical protein